MSASQDPPTKAERKSRGLNLHFWGGKKSVMGSGLLAEAFMWPKRYESTRATRQGKRDAQRAALGTVQDTKSIHEEDNPQTAETEVANDPETEVTHEPANQGNQVGLLARDEIPAAVNDGTEGDVQPQNPAAPDPSEAPSIQSRNTNGGEQAAGSAESPPVVSKAPSFNMDGAKSNADANQPKALPETPYTPPPLSKPPSVTAASVRSAPASKTNGEEVPEQGGQAACDPDEKNDSVKQPVSAPPLRGAGPPSKSHTSNPVSKQGSVFEFTVPALTKSTPSQSKKPPQHQAASSQRLAQPPPQPQTSATSRSILSSPSVAPSIPQLHFSRTHSVGCESSISHRGEADAAAPRHGRVTPMGQHWLNKRPESSGSGYKQASSKCQMLRLNQTSRNG